MNRNLIAAAAIALALAPATVRGQQPELPPQLQPPKVVRPAPRLSLIDTIKQHVRRMGATVDESKSTADMVVSNYNDPRGSKTTIVIVNDRRKNLLGFYIYNFGSVKNAPSREEIYKYLLSTNDSIAIGSFFVDGDDDIGYKYLVSAQQPPSLTLFELAYMTMATVTHERRPEIRRILGIPVGKEEKPSEVKKAAEEKPPE